MATLFPHIEASQLFILRQTIASMVESIETEKIICYGSRTYSRQSWSCFSKKTGLVVTSHYDILVITRGKGKGKRDEISNNINKYNNLEIKFTAVIHNLDNVKDALKEGNFFFTTVCHHGILLHENNDLPLIATSGKKIKDISASQIEFDWHKGHGLGRKFHEGARYSSSHAWNDIAVFMLHQAVEHTCIALIRIHMGYRTGTHRLGNLLDLIENFSPFNTALFPRVRKEEIKLFTVLEKAYSDARYKADYVVSEATVITLTAQVKEFLEIAEQLYIEKLKGARTRSSIVSTARDLPPFESICLDTFAHVVLEKGECESIRVDPASDIGNTFEAKTDGSRLWVFMPKSNPETTSETIYIIYKKLNGLVVNHAGNITSKEPIEGPILGIIQNGNGDINLEVDVNSLDVTLLKNGHVTISGFADKVRILNHRSGNFQGNKLKASTARITIRGSGNVAIHVEDELEAELHGTGDLLYSGTPRLKSILGNEIGRLKPLG